MNDNYDKDKLDDPIERLEDEPSQDSSLDEYNKTLENQFRSLFRSQYYADLLPENIDFQQLNELYESLIKSKKREELIMLGTVLGSIFIPTLLFTANSLEFINAIKFSGFLFTIEVLVFIYRASYIEKKTSFTKQIIDLRRGKNKKPLEIEEHSEEEGYEEESKEEYDEL